MRARLPILVTVAGAAALGAVFLARSWLDDRRAELAALERSEPVQVETIDTVEVLVSQEALASGTFLSLEQFSWTAFPADNIPESYLTRADLAVEAETHGNTDDPLSGAVIRGTLTEGEPLTVGQIIRPGDRGFLAAVLRPGKRAISVPVDATTGIAGFVFPGDQVDLLLTHEIEFPGNKSHFATETVLSDLRVLAVDQRTDHADSGPALAKTATLEVSPSSAEVIAVALRMGRLSLALRSLATLSDAPVTATPTSDATPVGSPSVAPAQTAGSASSGAPNAVAAGDAVEGADEDWRGYTWDSQASKLLPPAPWLRSSAPKTSTPAPTRKTVMVFRRSDAEELSFRGGSSQ